ncbi:RhoGAP domain-containing protein [Heterostelium album PN500]|uniref:RhoGAP domain-containing protein n=1 Tax=Heterostelium pallidum (strain ATCC 26659 / Pp 5 / PN500) TaxID=670386 RepID=D3B139_HETP5|nr:RhoGAP domain-containing protein [Heterostelium album PN500]EFA85013.1 RhoGAP domain-containing protein [Heterostelium album PN500]|eukprot:XP_020437123.1 RhoGAP domain-containing protein [Heterostelium album PN500]
MSRKNLNVEIGNPSGFHHVGGAGSAYSNQTPPPPLSPPPMLTTSPPKIITVGAQLQQQSTTSSRDPKSSAKSTIISNKLRKFFTHRPSRDSLYERHILNAPYGSGNLSFYNIFKIIVALKKANVLDHEGIFRVNGNSETIRSLWLSLNTQDLNLAIEHTAHDLAGLLKLYLRESRFPLIPIELFPNNSTPNKIETIRDFISKLPNENVKILHYLIEYLEQVTSNSAVNKMNPIALGVCFGPNIIRSISNNPQPDSLTQIQGQCNMITAMIENREFIFADQDGLLHQEVEEGEESYTSDRTVETLPLPPPPNSIAGGLYSSSPSDLIKNLFLNDPDNFKLFLKEILGIDGLISLLEVILTLE